MSSTEDPAVRSALQNLNVLFGDGRTVEDLKRVVKDGESPIELRMAALKSLVDAGAKDTKSICLELLQTRFLNTLAAEGLARENDPQVGQRIVQAYRRFHPSERPQAISVLTSRPAWARALLLAVADGKVDRSEISAFQARQIANLQDSEVMELLAEHWGQIRVSDEQKRAQIKSLKQELQPEVLAEADPREGRRLFDKSCASCHVLFGQGGKIGPDLTGAQRSNLDYLLENIVDPSAVVTKEFRATLILLEDDRVLSGLVTEETENVVTLATQNEVFKLAKESIVSMKKTDQSTMPEGLLDQLSDAQVRNLFVYLQSDRQVASE
jgi:putative heme-binding domain-containing protein